MRERASCHRVSVAAMLVALAAFAPPAARAQATRYYAGFNLGVTYSDLTNYLTTLDWRWGATAGGQIGVVSFDYAFVETGLSATRVGGGHISLDYVALPVLLGGVLPLGARDRLVRVYAGVRVSARVGCGAGETVACDVARPVVWSTLVGASLLKVLRSGHFAGVDGGYDFGMSNVFDVTDTTQRSWQLRVLVGGPLGRS